MKNLDNTVAMYLNSERNNKPKVGDRFKDSYNNTIQIICDDWTGLGREIVYGQFVDRVGVPVTPEQFAQNMISNKSTPCTFALWDFQWPSLIPLE